ARSGTHRRRERVADLRPGRRAAAEADHCHAGRVHAARDVERFHVAADRIVRPGSLHAAGRACEPVARARAGQRADDGGCGADDAAGARRVPLAAALLHAGAHAGRSQGMTTKRFAMALALVAAMVATIAYAQPPSEARTLDRFDDVTAWKAVASDGVTASIARVVDGK